MDRTFILIILLILIVLPVGIRGTDNPWVIGALLVVVALVLVWLFFSLLIRGRKIYFLEKGIDLGRYYLIGNGKIEMHKKSLFIPYEDVKKIKIESLLPQGKFLGKVDLSSMRYYGAMLELHTA